GIRDFHVTGVRRVLFRSTLMHITSLAPELSATSRWLSVWFMSALLSCSAARVTISTTRQFLVLDIGAISTTRTVSPSLQELSASWACSLLERRMYLPYSACLTWRSTRTVTVLSILLLTTRPSTVRSFFSVFSVILGLPYFCAPESIWPSSVLTRPISPRTRRAWWVLSSWPVAFCMRSENCSLCSSTRWAWRSWADFSRSSLMVAMSAHRPGHELGGDRELGGGQAERLARGRLVDALDLVDHAARLDLRDPVLDVALAGAHADLDRKRHV